MQEYISHEQRIFTLYTAQHFQGRFNYGAFEPMDV